METRTEDLDRDDGRALPSGESDVDADLMARFAAGDDGAFETLLTRRRQWVLNLVYRFVGDREEAEDLAQEAFVRLYRARRRYRPTARFSTFLYRLVTNLCLNETRRRQRRPTVVLEAADEVAADDSPAKTATRRELAAQVQTALRRLPDNQRLAMVLFRFEGLSQREVAEAMECSVGAVEALLHRAGRNLRRDLQEYVEES